MRRRSLRMLPLAAVIAVVVALVVGAALAPGLPTTDLRLHDGSVYVTKRSSLLIGKLNRQIDELASSVSMVNDDFDIAQAENRVLALDRRTNQLQRVDPVTSTLDTPVRLPAQAQVSLGGDTVVVTNPATGATWARPFDQAFGVEYTRVKADVDLGPGGVSAVGLDGRLVAVSVVRGELITTSDDGDRAVTAIPYPVSATGLELSVVAGTAVLLDRVAGLVWVEGQDPVHLDDAATARLQAPSADTVRTDSGRLDAVVATSTGLVGIVDGAATQMAAASGTPSQPVVVGGCGYGAWAGGATTAAVVRLCSGETEGAAGPVTTPVPSVPATASLVFRVNRDQVVLNDEVGGNVWLVNDQVQLIAGWDKVTPPKPKQGDDTEQTDTTTQVDPNRSGANHKPQAVDDTVSARAGRSTGLPLLDNDSDPDGDILTFSRTTEPATGALGRIRGGTGLQLSLPADAGGRLSFGYTITDGRGGTDSATVTVSVLPADQSEQNRAPVRFRDNPVRTTPNETATVRVLPDWRDPDGDDLVLIDAAMADRDSDDEVRFTADGTLTYTDAGTTAGRKEIQLTVSDGQDAATGTLVVEVAKSGTAPPVANGDFRTATTDQPIVVRPLDNDVGNDIYLTRVQTDVSGARVDPDYEQSWFTFTATKPGSYYVGYIVTNGPTDFGLVRIDVTAPPTENRAPVAAHDVALLPAGGSVLIDPLANDEDPDNDVVVIQSVDASDGLRVQQSQRQLLEITAVSAPDRPVQIDYTISDGHASATGTITVIPTTSTQVPRPTATPDEATVRAGDSVSVRVLANDSSPIGLPLALDALSEPPEAGVAWLDGDMLRFTAPLPAGEYHAIYQLRDTQGRTASAQVRFFVVSTDSPNNPPAPQAVTARVLSGTTTRVPIPLRRIDPDGDTVRLVGLDTAPSLGRVLSVGEGWLEYQAYTASAGTDTFSYAVIDARGERGVGQVRIGVAPPAADNAPPSAVADHVTARPGRLVRIPVLGNDSDPDNDSFGFAADALRFPGIDDARIVDNAVQFTMPTQTGTTPGQYTIVDRRGAEATGDVSIVSDPAAPLLPPVLRDDLVTATDVNGKTEIDVPVLANDYDPDGDLAGATVSLPQPRTDLPQAEQPRVVGQKIRVTVGASLQVIRYEVTDVDQQKGWALILVPGKADAVPALRADVTAQKVKAGESIELAINDFVLGTQGRRVQLTTEDRIWGSNGAASAVNTGTVRFDAPSDYVGPASITFEVTDHKSAEDGRTAVLTVPITVLANDTAAPDQRKKNTAPTFADLTITIGAGEGPKSQSITAAAQDADGDKLTFTEPTGRVPRGVRIGYAAGRVTAEAEPDVAPGTSVELTGTVSDGTATVATRVTVDVVKSTRPLVVASDDVVPDAVQGKPSTVAVLANDGPNPFPDVPLRVLRTRLEAGRASAVVSGSRVVVTPAADFVGQVVVRYTVVDATNSADRQVDARIRLTVRGKPSRPGTPRRSEVGNRRAVITWTAPEDNGSPITRYTVRAAASAGAAVTQRCPTTTCTITGLTNNVRYRFTVVATNQIGDSPPSASSAEVRPDYRPDPPGTPQPTFGDRSIALKWVAAPVPGRSPVTAYVVELTGPTGLQRRTLGPATAYTWSGLENGASYTFRVRAKNSAPEPSGWSARSKAMVPAGKPSPPQTVTVSDVGGNLGRQIKVSWRAPADSNGDAVRSYRVLANGAQVATTDGSTTTATVRLTNGTTYTFTVSATNKAGRSAASRASAAITPFGAPRAPTAVRLTPGNHQVKINFSGAVANGKPITLYNARLNGGAPFRATNAMVRRGLDNGASYAVQVQACAGAKCSTWSARSAAVRPYGPPAQPNPGASHLGGVRYRFSWNYPARSNGDAIAKVETSLNGAGWVGRAHQGSIDAGSRGNQSLTLRVRVTNAHGQTAVGSVSRTTPSPAVRTFAGKLTTGIGSSCPSQRCFEVHAEVSNFPANTAVTCVDSNNIKRAVGRTDQRGHIGNVGPMGSLGQNRDDYWSSCSGGGVTKRSPQAASWPK